MIGEIKTKPDSASLQSTTLLLLVAPSALPRVGSLHCIPSRCYLPLSHVLTTRSPGAGARRPPGQRSSSPYLKTLPEIATTGLRRLPSCNQSYNSSKVPNEMIALYHKLGLLVIQSAPDCNTIRWPSVVTVVALYYELVRKWAYRVGAHRGYALQSTASSMACTAPTCLSDRRGALRVPVRSSRPGTSRGLSSERGGEGRLGPAKQCVDLTRTRPQD